MVTKGLLVQLEAKAGKEADVEAFLKSALPLVQEEPDTVAWFAIKFSANQFGIFDVFPSDEGRDAHLSGPIAKALMENASTLLASAPSIQKIDIIASDIKG
ncbi:MAG: antibiotic biosynthesis monooxygenase [Gemmatimonadales bacterium]